MIFAALNYIAIFGSKTNDLAISSINKQFRLQLCLLTINAGTQPGHRLSSHYGHTDPLIRIRGRWTWWASPGWPTWPGQLTLQCTGDSGTDGLWHKPWGWLRPQTRSHKQEHVYDELLNAKDAPESQWAGAHSLLLLSLMNSRRDAAIKSIRVSRSGSFLKSYLNQSSALR